MYDDGYLSFILTVTLTVTFCDDIVHMYFEGYLIAHVTVKLTVTFCDDIIEGQRTNIICR